MGSTTRVIGRRSSTGLLIATCAVLYLGGCERRQIANRSAADNRPTAGETPADERGPSSDADRASRSSLGKEGASNQAVELAVASSSLTRNLGGSHAPDGRAFVVLQTRWRNIHPKQEVEKSKLEGQRDHTLGVGGFARGETSADREYVEVDVAYTIPQMRDHVYLLADGVAYALDERTQRVDRGLDPGSELVIEKNDEVRDLGLVFVVPEDTEHLGLQLLDYSYGHVLVPVEGSIKRARGDSHPPKGCVVESETQGLEIATRGIEFRDVYRGDQAGPGRIFAIVDLVGKSLSRGGAMRNIVEVDPTQYLWVTTDGGFMHYAEPCEGARGRPIRFTPEVFQHQTVAFLVPDTADRLRLGVRVQNEVVELDLTERRPREMPKAQSVHTDGEVMEVLYFGSRRQAHQFILDLGIRPLSEERGLEIQPSAQFMLVAGESELSMDSVASAALPHPPPRALIVPPGTAVRFELAFTTEDTPTAVRIRGFRSEATIGLE